MQDAVKQHAQSIENEGRSSQHDPREHPLDCHIFAHTQKTHKDEERERERERDEHKETNRVAHEYTWKQRCTETESDQDEVYASVCVYHRSVPISFHSLSFFLALP